MDPSFDDDEENFIGQDDDLPPMTEECDNCEGVGCEQCDYTGTLVPFKG